MTMEGSRGESAAVGLHQLISAPIIALAQAEAQSDRVTVEFIERVGFVDGTVESTRPENSRVAGSEEPLGAGELGHLRMASLGFQRLGPGGILRSARAQVPVLSLVPIPNLNIKDVELEFYVKILDAKPRPGRDLTGALSAEEESALGGQQLALLGQIGSGPSAKDKGTSRKSQIKIKVSFRRYDREEVLADEDAMRS